MTQSRWGGLLVAAASSNKLSSLCASFSVSPPLIRRPSSQITRLYASSLPPKQELSDDEIESEVMAWVHRVVVGWNLCPFADKPLKQGKLFVHTVRGSDEETILGTVLGEMLVRKDLPGTTLVIAPECHPNDFAMYLSFVSALDNDFMDEYDLHGHVQVAPFHPLFEFSGSGKDGIDNYTNRAPYPIFHVLRESEVESAVDKLGGDASQVWKRNVELLEDMQDTLGGNEGVVDAMRGDSSSLKQKVDEVLKRHRFKLNGKQDD
jgi:hypothetical protein